LIKPKSVVDVGCATGEFLYVFYKNGVKDILGIDGEWLKGKKLLIPKKFFLPLDLEKPLKIEREFDLVICLEVAEHLSKKSAEKFVKTLTNLSPIILFSAAIPYQGGIGHKNEQWPEYWIKLFSKRGYLPIDSIRKRTWDNNEVHFTYSQNIFLFVKKEYLKKNKVLSQEFKKTNNSFFSVVHPKLYLRKAKKCELINKIIPGPIKHVIIKFMNFSK
jgi:SAM-dependent methyltransferase